MELEGLYPWEGKEKVGAVAGADKGRPERWGGRGGWVWGVVRGVR